MASQLMVPGSASTKGNADFRNSATSFSLPGLASRGTYKAILDIVYSHIAAGFAEYRAQRDIEIDDLPPITVALICFAGFT